VRTSLHLEKGLWEMAKRKMFELFNAGRAVGRVGIVGIVKREEKRIIHSAY